MTYTVTVLVLSITVMLGYFGTLDLRLLNNNPASTTTTASVVQFYDLIGGILMNDWYHYLFEEKSMDIMISECEFSPGQIVVEIGPGSGFLAEKIIRQVKSMSTEDQAYFSYTGIDMSHTMYEKASKRLNPFIVEGIAQLHVVNDTFTFLNHTLKQDSVDRFVFTYVLDLLPPGVIAEFAHAVHDKLNHHHDGRVCVVNLTYGYSLFSRIVTNIWQILYRVLGGEFMGGCRPIHAQEYFSVGSPDGYQVEHMSKTVSSGLPSEVAVFSLYDGV